MKEINKKKIVVLSSILVIGIISVLSINISLSPKKEKVDIVKKEEKKKVDIVSPVISESTGVIKKPYLNEEVKILKNYYDYQGTEEEQENSITYYESTYMPNYAICYGGPDSFEVTSILDGTVINVKEDSLLGNIVEIQHDNDIISVYQSVSDVTVEPNQIVKQGEVIAHSGTSNINKDLENHLSFELLYKNQIVNPEEYYNKDINELG